MDFKKNYYKILGVNLKDDDECIKKAYKKLARKYHPDVNKSEGAVKQFELINEAYDVLSNEETRKEYTLQRAAYVRKVKQSKTTALVKKETGLKKRNNGLAKYKKSKKRSNNSLATVKNGVGLVSTLEKDYGLISGLTSLSKGGRRGSSLLGGSSHGRGRRYRRGKRLM